MYMSIHRHEHAPGVFYPAEGSSSAVGRGPGAGFNVNVALPFELGGYGDPDYAFLVDALLPRARAFDPQAKCCPTHFERKSNRKEMDPPPQNCAMAHATTALLFIVFESARTMLLCA